MSLERIWLRVQPQSPKRNAVESVLAGRSRRCRTFWRVTLAIAPTLCQQHSAVGDDHHEQGQHVHRHASERLSCRRFWPDGGWNDENPSRYQRPYLSHHGDMDLRAPLKLSHRGDNHEGF